MGDESAPVTVEDLLGQAGWVRGLAQRLVGDSEAANDISQEVLLTATKTPPPSGHNLRSWLRRVTINEKNERYRTESRLDARQKAAARPEAQPSAADLVLRAEMQKHVVSCVLELAEPLRQVVLMKYFDGKNEHEIAAALGESPATIRTRIVAGHEALRARFAGEHGPEWRAVLLPILRWPDPTPAAPPAHPSDPRLPVRAVATTAGVAAIGALVWWALGGSDPAPAAPRDTDLAATGAATHTRVAAGRTARASRPGDAESGLPRESDATGQPGRTDATFSPAGAPSDAPRLRVTGTVVSDDGSKPGRVALTLTPLAADKDPSGGTPIAVAASSGTYAIELPYADAKGRRIAEWEVTSDSPDHLPSKSRIHMPLRSQGVANRDAGPIALVRAGYVTGTVTWDGTDPSARATVAAPGLARNLSEFVDVAEVAPGGRFRLRVRGGADSVVLAAVAGLAPLGRPVRVEAGATLDVGELALPQGVRVRGQIRCALLPVAAKQTVSLVSDRKRTIELTLGSNFVGWDEQGAWRYLTMPPLDAEGRYTAEGFAPGPFHIDASRVVAGAASDVIAAATSRSFDAPTDEAELTIGGTLVRVSVRTNGVAVAGAQVDVAQPGAQSAVRTTDAEGAAQFLCSPGVTYRVRCGAKGYADAETHCDASAAGVESSVTVELTPKAPEGAAKSAIWNVTFQIPGGVAPELASFGFFDVKNGRLRAAPKAIRDVKSADGVFRIDDVPPGRWLVECRPGAGWFEASEFLISTPFEHEFVAGDETSDTVPAIAGGRLVVTAEGVGGKRAGCRILDAANAEVHCTFANRSLRSIGTSWNGLSEFGATDVCPALPPGRYTVECSIGPKDAQIVKSTIVEIVAGQVTEAKVPF